MRVGLSSSVLLCALILLTSIASGCAPRVSITRVDASTAYRERTASVLNGRNLSERTLQVLRIRDLDGRWDRDPDAVLAQLGEEHLEASRSSTDSNDLTPALTELLISRGDEVERNRGTDPTYYLRAAELAHTQMRRDASYLGAAFDSRTAFLASLYNRAVSRFFSSGGWEMLLEQDDARETVLSGFAGAYSTAVSVEPGDWQRGYFDRFESADEVVVQGIRNHHRVEGYGTALVGVRNRTPERESTERFIPPEGLALPVTVTLDFEPMGDAPTRAIATMHNPRENEYAWLGGVRARLSEDLTAPIAYLFAKTKLGELGQSALPNPNEYVDRIGIYLHEPYDPNRIPVLMVHGLRSSPITWRDALNDLGADPALRSDYQFWMFLYPTGLPIPRSSAYLRESVGSVLDFYDPERESSTLRDIVMIGHSMGGVLTKSVLITPGTRVYDAAFIKPLEQLRSEQSVKEHLREVFFYEPLNCVGRAVFIAAPLRGSPLAGGALAAIGRGLIRLPDELRQVGKSLREKDRDAMAPGFDRLGDGVPTSVHNLRPDSPFLLAYQEAPMSSVPHHVIVGDRGRDDGESSSDGVVPFWSSRMESAESTLSVPAGHEAHTHPLAIRELARILRLHLRAHQGGSDVKSE